MKSQKKADGSPEKSKVSKWVIGALLLFMVGMFALSVTPYGLAVWLGPEDKDKRMDARIQQAPLHREAGALAEVFQMPVLPKEVFWREVSMRRPWRGVKEEDKALWAVLHYEEAGFEALRALLPEGRPVDFKVFLPGLVEDVEKNMALKLSPGVEIQKLPAELFAKALSPPESVGAYLVPSQRSLLLMRFGATEFLVKAKRNE